MVSCFLRVDGLFQTHNLLRHRDPKDKLCFYQTGRMSLLVVSALSCDLRHNSEVRHVADCTGSNCVIHKRILTSIHGGLLMEPYIIVT